MIRLTNFEDSLNFPQPLYIDVRSENEYKKDHIPGSLNIPLLNDQEKKQVGIVYKNQGPEIAKRVGLSIVSPKLPEMVRLIEEAGSGKQVILNCWRGGLRSQSLGLILNLMNLPVFRLNGGYKKYRQWIYRYFYEEIFPFEIIVIHGLTGTGKTRVIQKLSEMNIATVDLEGLANNRGSVFGSVGLTEQPSQKLFESLLWYQLHRNQKSKFIVVECESKRIGKINLPFSFFHAMNRGTHILLFDSIDNRIERITSEYQVKFNDDDLMAALRRLKVRLGNEGKNYHSVVEKLLLNYYDPLYKYPDRPSSEFDLCVMSSDIEQAANQIFNWITNLGMR